MKQVLHYFKEICRIPHGSGNMDGICGYLLKFADDHGLTAKTDDARNVIIYKDATPGYEDSETVILQGHCDMVCEKDADVVHDFLKDPLELVTEGDWLSARGTTLGGDDGIAVAYMLAILERDDISHPPLECVFTTDEEVGMLGALALDFSALKGRRMLNLDSEEEGVLLAGCAGGMSQRVRIPVARETVELSLFRLRILGLCGGHSGNEIHKGRGNAAKLSGRLLGDLEKDLEFRLIHLTGGTKDNAIPRTAELVIGLEEQGAKDALCSALARRQKIYAREFRGIENELRIECEEIGRQNCEALDANSFARVLFYLQLLPDGVQKMSGEVEKLVETSCNLGIMALEPEALFAVTSVRSSLESAKIALAERICFLAQFLGGSVEVEGVYPAWEFVKDCPWRDMAVRVYEELRGEAPKVEVIHAGLECGLFYENLPGLSCISIGPDMRDIHTSRERLSLSSSERTYQYVLEILKAAKED